MKIILFCAGGLSSSMLVSRIQEAANQRNIDCTVQAFGARSFNRLDGADVLLIAPQVRFMHKTYAQKVKIPYAFIDMSSYGMMNGEAALDLALDTMNKAQKPAESGFALIDNAQ